MYRKRLRFKLFSIVLCIVLITISVTQQQTFAATSKDQQEVKRDEEKTTQNSKKRQEVLKLRKEKSRTYINEDGTYTTDISQIPVNYKDKKSNTWLPITNKLKSDSNKAYNDSNSFQTSLKKKYSKSSALLEITEDKYKVSLNPIIDTVSSATGTVSENTINYKDFSSNSDLKYSLGNDRVKEEIILKKKPNEKKQIIYSFALNLQGLNYNQEEDGSISLLDPVTNEKVYYIQQPYMFDSYIPKGYVQAPNVNSFPEEALSYDIQYQIHEENDALIVDVIPNQDWLNDEKRVYPVTIDPTIVKFQPNSSLLDTNIRSAFPTQTGAAESTLGVGLYKDSTQTNVIRSLIKFDISSLPAGAAILTADLNLWLAAVSNNTEVGVTIHGITNSWTETAASWNKATDTVSWTKPGGDFNTAQMNTENVSSLTDKSVNYKWAISTTAIESWINDPSRNKGVLLKSNVEGTNSYKKFISSDDTANVGYTPMLSLTYYPASRLGFENYWAFDNHYFANGTSYTNLGTGNNVIQFSDYSFKSRGDTDLNFTRTYNSKAIETSPMGYGWSYSGGESIVEATGSGIILYTEKDGTSHEFRYDSTKGYYLSDAGKYLILKKDKEGQLLKGYTISDKYGYKLYFDQPLADLESTYVKARISYEEDLHGNRISYNYNSNNTLESITDAYGKKVSFVYGSDGFVDYIVSDGLKTDFTYLSGKLSIVDQYLKDGSKKTTKFLYNNDNRISTVIDSEGRKTDFTYNQELLAKVQEPFDSSSGNDLSDRPGTSYTFDLAKYVAVVTDPDGKTTTSYMNNNNVIIKTIDPEMIQTVYTLDDNFNQVEINESNNGITSNSYDLNGNLLNSIEPDGHSVIYTYDDRSNITHIMDSENGQYNYVYNNVGDLSEYTDNSNEVTKYTYDQFGELLATYFPDNTSESYEYDENNNLIKSFKDISGNIIKSVIDPKGNVISTTDGKNNETRFEYNSNNKITKVIDADNNETKYEYDNKGSLQKVFNSKLFSKNYEIDGDNLISETDQLSNSWINSYDDEGRLLTYQTPNGNTTTNKYNTQKQLETVSINGVEKWKYLYGDQINETAIYKDGVLFKSREYYNDENNLLKKEVDRNNSKEYFYNNDGNVNKISYTVGSNSNNISYDFITNSQTDKIYKNDKLLVDFDYNTDTNLSYIGKGNGTHSELQYEPGNRIYKYSNFNEDGTLEEDYTYEYDKNTNITKLTTNSDVREYEYDKLNRLTKETLTDGSFISYSYDSLGNRIKKTITKDSITSLTNYTINAVDQIAAANGKSYQYDKDGNLINDGDYSYIYDELDQLIEMKKNNVSIFKAKYDNAGRRIQTETTNGIINYFYDEGQHVIFETDENNNIITEYTWDNQGYPISMSKGGETYFYNVNGHGDVVSLTDTNGNIVASYDYDAWGNIISHSGNMQSVNPYRYAGYRYDEITGLYYLTSRYYNPDTGRFLTKDTYAGKIDNPQSLNLYSYAANNPVNLVDLSGHTYAWALNVISKSYNKGYYNDEWASIAVFSANALSFLLTANTNNNARYQDLYVPFHEIAQINVAKALYKKYKKNAELEKKLYTGQTEYWGLKKKTYEADIVLDKQVWEVKPYNGADPKPQLELYRTLGNLNLGGKLNTIQKIIVWDTLYMQITFPKKGEVRYRLFVYKPDGTKRFLETAGAANYLARLMIRAGVKGGKRFGPAFG